MAQDMPHFQKQKYYVTTVPFGLSDHSVLKGHSFVHVYVGFRRIIRKKTTCDKPVLIILLIFKSFLELSYSTC